MQIDTTLLVKDKHLIEGLLNGSLKRFGGVVRDASNGQIVKHLLEAPSTSNLLMRAPMPNLLGGVGSLIDGIGHGVTIHKLNQVQHTLSSVLQVSQVAAAASVLNLGVSVAGFIYMGYKLNQLQNSMAKIQECMNEGFKHIDEKLNAIAGQLSYLLLLTEANSNEQRRISTSLAELHRAVLVAQLAELQSWLDHLSRFPDDSPKDAIRSAGKVRHLLSDQAERIMPQFEPQVMLVADITIRGWIVATATEANLLMSMGQHREARQLIESEHPRFFKLAERWAERLLADERPTLHTALRFDTPRFKSFILPERVHRIVRLNHPDRELTDERQLRVKQEAALEFEMSYNNAALNDDWTHRQLAVAEYLDGLSEMSSRLETIQAFAYECEVRSLPSSQAALPGPEAPPGIYVLSATE